MSTQASEEYPCDLLAEDSGHELHQEECKLDIVLEKGESKCHSDTNETYEHSLELLQAKRQEVAQASERIRDVMSLAEATIQICKETDQKIEAFKQGYE